MADAQPIDSAAPEPAASGPAARLSRLVAGNFGTHRGLVRLLLGEAEYLSGRVGPFIRPDLAATMGAENEVPATSVYVGVPPKERSVVSTPSPGATSCGNSEPSQADGPRLLNNATCRWSSTAPTLTTLPALAGLTLVELIGP